MRLFVGIDIPEEIRNRITRFVESVRPGAPDARWVKPETFHVTLKFVGELPAERVDDLKSALARVTGTPIEIAFRGIGFFTPRSPRVFWAGVKADESLASLAANVDAACVELGVVRDDHPYSPHLTLARTGSGRPQGSRRDRVKPAMWHLRDAVQSAPQPDFGTMTAHEFFLYESKLSPAGAQYTKIARFPLG